MTVENRCKVKKSLCYLCGSAKYKVRPGCVRDNAQLKVIECLGCGLVFLSSFDHIHNGFYENSGIHSGQIDRDAWLKETACDDERRFNSLQRILENKTVLDFGCGNGGFLVRARNMASDGYGGRDREFFKILVS